MGLLPGRAVQPSVTAKGIRLFINAVLWIGKSSGPWRDLPDRFGPWNSVWRRFDRWARKGVRLRDFEVLQDPDLEWLLLDSSVVQALQHAAGKKGVPDPEGSDPHPPITPAPVRMITPRGYDRRAGRSGKGSTGASACWSAGRRRSSRPRRSGRAP